MGKTYDQKKDGYAKANKIIKDAYKKAQDAKNLKGKTQKNK